MPFADYTLFREMIDHAFRKRYAFPAINVHDIFTLNGVIEGFARAESDGIVQIYPDAAAAVSGEISDPVIGAVTLAEHAHRLAERYGVAIAVHTDHCGPEQCSSYLLPLIEETKKRRARGERNLFTSHMFDGSALPLPENLAASKKYFELCRENDLWLEIEIGIVGAENETESADVLERSKDRKLYTCGDDFLSVYTELGAISGEGFLVAPAFGNVHGVYKPGEVSLKPEILRECQRTLSEARGEQSRFKLVFHGGSGSSVEEINRAIEFGVVKMNFDTDGQYVFTRSVIDYMLKNYDSILRVDGEVGVKRAYFAETWLKVGEEVMSSFVSDMCRKLGSAGNSVLA